MFKLSSDLLHTISSADATMVNISSSGLMLQISCTYVELLIPEVSFPLWFLSQKLERLQDEELVEKPFIRKQMKIRFPERGRSGKTVVTIKNMDFSYGDKVS